jgi:hypothetical protein
MAEWLGRGLQILVRRFDSASDLRKKNFARVVEWYTRGT